MPSDLREHDFREFLERMAGEMPTPDEVPRRALRHARARLVRTVVAGSLAVVLLAVGSLAGVRGLLRASPPRPADEVGRPPSVAIPIQHGTATDVTVGAGSVWVAGSGAFRIDPDTERVIAAYSSTSARDAGDTIVVGESSTWIAGGGFDGEILRIDPTTDEVVATIHAGGYEDPYSLAAGAGAVWATLHHEAVLLRIEPEDDSVDEVRLPDGIERPRTGVHGIAVLDGTVWIVASGWDDGHGELYGTSADAPGNWSHIPVKVYEQIRAGFGALWGQAGNGAIVRIDPVTGEVLARIDIGFSEGPGNGVRVAVGEGAVWVSDGVGTIYRIDPVADRVAGSLAFDPPIEGLAAGEGALWAADGERTVYRIDPSAFGSEATP